MCRVHVKLSAYRLTKFVFRIRWQARQAPCSGGSRGEPITVLAIGASVAVQAGCSDWLLSKSSSSSWPSRCYQLPPDSAAAMVQARTQAATVLGIAGLGAEDRSASPTVHVHAQLAAMVVGLPDHHHRHRDLEQRYPPRLPPGRRPDLHERGPRTCRAVRRQDHQRRHLGPSRHQRSLQDLLQDLAASAALDAHGWHGAALAAAEAAAAQAEAEAASARAEAAEARREATQRAEEQVR